MRRWQKGAGSGLVRWMGGSVDVSPRNTVRASPLKPRTVPVSFPRRDKAGQWSVCVSEGVGRVCVSAKLSGEWCQFRLNCGLNCVLLRKVVGNFRYVLYSRYSLRPGGAGFGRDNLAGKPTRTQWLQGIGRVSLSVSATAAAEGRR